MSDQPTTVYDWIGGASTIRRLVIRFYELVAADPVLRPLFPDDFTEVRERQYMFLTQLFDGPRLYSEQYGAPMLRMRHLRFPITRRHAEAWLACMDKALDYAGIKNPAREFMFDRLTKTAYHMINTTEEQEHSK